MQKMASKKPIDDSHEPEIELRPDSAEHLGLAEDTSGTEPVLAQKMLDSEKEWLRVTRRGSRMAGARQGATRRRFAEDFGSNTIHYHRVLSRLLNSPTAEATEPVLVHWLRAVRDSQDA